MCVVALAAAAPMAPETPPAAPAPTPSAAPTGTAAKTEPPTPSSAWVYDEQVDQMRDVTSSFATLVSTNEVNLGSLYGESRLVLLLRKGPKFGNDLIVHLTSGQTECSYGGCTVAFKFDGGKVQAFRADRSASAVDSAMFIRNVEGVVAKLRASSSLVVEVDTFTTGARQFTFDTRGLSWEPYKGKVLRD